MEKKKYNNKNKIIVPKLKKKKLKTLVISKYVHTYIMQIEKCKTSNTKIKRMEKKFKSCIDVSFVSLFSLVSSSHLTTCWKSNVNFYLSYDMLFTVCTTFFFFLTTVTTKYIHTWHMYIILLKNVKHAIGKSMTIINSP